MKVCYLWGITGQFLYLFFFQPPAFLCKAFGPCLRQQFLISILTCCVFFSGPGQSVVSINTECESPLGLESGGVKASDTTATSTYTVPNEDYSPTLGRLNNKVFNQFGISYKGIKKYHTHIMYLLSPSSRKVVVPLPQQSVQQDLPQQDQFIGRVLDCRTRCRGFHSRGRTDTQGLKNN